MARGAEPETTTHTTWAICKPVYWFVGWRAGGTAHIKLLPILDSFLWICQGMLEKSIQGNHCLAFGVSVMCSILQQTQLD